MENICLFCKSEILDNKSKKKYCNRKCYNNDHITTLLCIKCNKEFQVPSNRKNSKYCSIQCSNSGIDRKKSKEKASNTLMKKYGVTNPFEVKGYDNLSKNSEKRSYTMLKSWSEKTIEERIEIGNKISTGLKNLSDKEKKLIQIKKENTNLERFGDKSAFGKNSSIRIKIDNNLREKFKQELYNWLENNNIKLLDEYLGVKEKNGDLKYYKFQHIPSGNIFIDHVACGRLPQYRDPNLSQGISNLENEIQEFIKSLNINYEIIFNNRKIIKGMEMDIYIPDLRIAFEINGIYWHSELNGKSKDYHLYKTIECEKLNIRLIQIFEDEWLYKKDIVKSRIKYILGQCINKIYARKCEIREIKDNITKNNFLNLHHIQGEDKSKIKLGLYYNNELVSIMTFGNLRKITGNISELNCYELIRFCNKLETNVIGGFSKLLKYFIKNYKPKQIISFADRRWSLGNIYEKNGFTFIHNTQPNYWYMKYYKIREHRFKYRKSELQKILSEFNKDLSEWENMKNNKFDRIWDCGSKKYEINFY